MLVNTDYFQATAIKGYCTAILDEIKLMVSKLIETRETLKIENKSIVDDISSLAMEVGKSIVNLRQI